MKTAKNTSKEVTVIARVQFKNDARKVVYRVLSSNGQTVYHTFLFNGKATSCECPATKPYYHMNQCEAKEAARNGVQVDVSAVNAAANLRYAYGYHD